MSPIHLLSPPLSAVAILPRFTASQGQSVRREIRETCDRIVKDISERLYENIMSGRMPAGDELLTQNDLVDIKRRVFSIQGLRSEERRVGKECVSTSSSRG